MALKVTVSSGKQELPRSSAGLVKRPAEEAENKHPNITINDVVQSVFQEVRSSLDKEADVEVEFTAAVEINHKDGETSINLDIGPDTGNTRTMRVKFSTKLSPNQKEN